MVKAQGIMLIFICLTISPVHCKEIPKEVGTLMSSVRRSYGNFLCFFIVFIKFWGAIKFYLGEFIFFFYTLSCRIFFNITRWVHPTQFILYKILPCLLHKKMRLKILRNHFFWNYEVLIKSQLFLVRNLQIFGKTLQYSS